MAEFLSGSELQEAILRLMERPGAKCAVAFWGQGSEKLVRPDATVICNLKSGGTNPYALEKLKVAKLLQCDRLHAKVYIGGNEAIVASANASANGLGLEGNELRGWLEAGTRLTDTTATKAWFKTIKAASRPISPQDLEAAKGAWDRGPIRKPTALSFGDFLTRGDPMPLLTWFIDADWEALPASAMETLGYFDDTVSRRIDDGLEIEGPQDVPLLKNQWLLMWPRGRNGLPPKRPSLSWTRLSDTLVPDAFRYTDNAKARDVMLGAEQQPPPPFDARERKFAEAFRRLLADRKFSALVENDYDGAWFAPRKKLIAQFWRDLAESYNDV